MFWSFPLSLIAVVIIICKYVTAILTRQKMQWLCALSLMHALNKQTRIKQVPWVRQEVQ